MQLNEARDLRGGRVCWREDFGAITSDPLPAHVEVLIIGAGVMGAMLSERLSAEGWNVAIVDRRGPVLGTTASSTALVMWAADVPLLHLIRRYDEQGAVARWRRVFAGVEQLSERISALGVECGWKARPEIYLSGSLLDEHAMKSEARLRQDAGLPSLYENAYTISERFAIAPRAGLVSQGSYEVDPVALSVGMLNAAKRNGASLCFPHDVARLETVAGRGRVVLASGEIVSADRIVLATGYEPARLYLPAAFALSSSYAIASKPGVAPAWRENALIWESCEPYLYARATADGRIIVGGEDEDFIDSVKRDALIGPKSGALQSKARAVLEVDNLGFEYAWASTFGGSPDGLPALGKARHADNVWLAYGYGGNGVTFAAVAAALMPSLLRGEFVEAARWFDPYRFEA